MTTIMIENDLLLFLLAYFDVSIKFNESRNGDKLNCL